MSQTTALLRFPDPLAVYRALCDQPADFARAAAKALAAEIFAKDPTITGIEIDMADDGPWITLAGGVDEDAPFIGDTAFASDQETFERIAADLFLGVDGGVFVYGITPDGQGTYLRDHEPEAS